MPLRSRIVQFTESFIAGALALMPELGAFRATLERSRRGVLFGAETAAQVGPLLRELVDAPGRPPDRALPERPRRAGRARDAQALTSASYLPDPSGYMSAGINKALAYINGNLTEPFSERDLAAIAGLSTGAFSRSFRRHTGWRSSST